MPSESPNLVSYLEDIPSPFGSPASSGQTLDSNLISLPRDEYAQFLANNQVTHIRLPLLGQALHLIVFSPPFMFQ
jgi:hypothetical protein